MTPFPAVSVDPPIGSTEITVPIALSLGTASIPVIVKPTAARAARASVSVIPIKSIGTMASPGPSLIVIVTTLPLAAREVASGLCDATRSIGVFESWARFTTTLKALSWAAASLSVNPTTFGTNIPETVVRLLIANPPTAINNVAKNPATICQVRFFFRLVRTISVVMVWPVLIRCKSPSMAFAS